MTKAIKGVYAAALTPFTKAGDVDTGRLGAYCSWLLEQGIDGVAPLGTTGEGNSISLAERCRVPGALAKANIPADRTIFGTGSCAFADAVLATKSALDAGYNNVLVLPPFYFKNAPDDGVHAYYARLIETIGDDRLRVYLYHFPQMSMTPFNVGLVQRLKADFGSLIAGLKDSSGDLAASIAFAAAADDFDVYPSNEGVYVDAVKAGCAGVISATTNASAPFASKVKVADEAAALDAQAKLAAVRKAIAKFPLSAALKEIQVSRSGDAAWREILPPQVALDAQSRRELLSSLSSLSDVVGFDIANALAA
ncbi:MAG: dihydrodipicolinate synthase family protein [Rhodospirillales bacterium]